MAWLQFITAALLCTILFGTGSLGTPTFASSAEGTPGFNTASELVGVIRGEETSSSVFPGVLPDFDATSGLAPRALHERKDSSVDGSDFKALDSDVQKLQDLLQRVAQTADDIQGDVAAGTENKRLRGQIAHIQTAMDKVIAKSKDFEKEAEHVKDGVAHTEEDDDDESAGDSGESSDWRLVFGNPATWACGALVTLTYMWFGYSFLFEDNDGYRQMRKEHAKSASKIAWAAATVAFFNYWVAMPLTLLAFSAQATCEGGAPDSAYVVYSIFLSLHLICAILVSQSVEKLPPIFTSKILSSLPVLSFFMVIEHFDMGTDTMFPGSALACNARVTPVWLHSWRSVPLIGNLAASALEPMGFGGFALLMFVAGAYIPQMVAMFSLFTFIFLIVAVGITVLWVSFGWIVGLLAVFFLAIGSYCSGLMWKQWEVFCGVIESAGSLAYMGGLLIFEDEVEANMPSEVRMLLLGLTKLVFENLLQLWIQSSLFSFTFDYMHDIARKKALVSIGLGLAVCFSKLLPACLAIYNVTQGPAPVWTSIIATAMIMVSAIFAAAWIVAKMYFAFACASHVWNLSSGCVPLPPSS